MMIEETLLDFGVKWYGDLKIDLDLCDDDDNNDEEEDGVKDDKLNAEQIWVSLMYKSASVTSNRSIFLSLDSADYMTIIQ